MSKGCVCDKCHKLIDTTMDDYIHIDMPNYEDGYNSEFLEVHLDFHRECIPDNLTDYINHI